MSAVEALSEKFQEDSNILAFVLQGSLAYDKVWHKSDVDSFIIVKDMKLNKGAYCVVENGIVINVDIMTRDSFRKGIEKSLDGGMWQSLIVKGKLMFTKDESLREYFDQSGVIGEADLELILMNRFAWLLIMLEKAEKWLYVKQDYRYCQLYTLNSSQTIADMIILMNHEVPMREVLQRAKAFEPELIEALYDDMLCEHKSPEQLEAALKLAYSFINKNLKLFTAPLIEYLSDNEFHTVTDIVQNSSKQAGSHGTIHICQYLTWEGIIEMASQTIKVTPKGKMNIEEVCYKLV